MRAKDRGAWSRTSIAKDRARFEAKQQDLAERAAFHAKHGDTLIPFAMRACGHWCCRPTAEQVEENTISVGTLGSDGVWE